MQYVETLENRTFLSSTVNWNKDVVHLDPGVTYTLNKPITPKSGQKIIGDKKNPPTLKLKQKGKSVIFIPPDTTKVQISNIRLDGYKNMPSIRVSGNSHTFSNISVTKSTGSAFIIENAEGVLIKDCNQTNITQRGFVYGNRFWNLVIRNVTTSGNLYENEFRFHRFDGLGIFNCRIDASNPNVNQGQINKENAIRVHDGKRAYINGLTVSGNVYFGVMDKNNGGLDSLKRGDIAEYKRKMALRSNVVAENIRIYGNLTLGTGLTFKINNIGMVSWDQGICISVNPKYGPFKNGFGLYRSPAKGTINGLTAKFTKQPPQDRSLGGLIKYFDRGVKINNTGKLISYTSDIRFVEVYFNKVEYRK